MLSIKRMILLAFSIVFIGIYFISKDFVFDRFSFKKIAKQKYFDKNLPAIQYSKEEIERLDYICSMPFYYLNKGRQTFVFVSQDNKYILKLFNTQRFSIPIWMQKLPLPKVFRDYRKRKMRKKQDKLNRFYFRSYVVAFNLLKPATGLLYMNLSGYRTLHKNIVIYDARGRSTTISLDRTPFILQKKAHPFYSVLSRCQSCEEKKQLIDNFFFLLNDRLNKNVKDDDLDIGNNYGVIGQSVILFDAGRLYLDEELNNDIDQRKKEAFVTTKQFRTWLKKNIPSLVVYFDNKMETVVNHQ